MSAFYQVVPSDGVGGASGHGLLATAKGLLRSRGGLVVSTANDSLFSVKCLSFFGGPHHWTYSNSRHDFFPLIRFYFIKMYNYQRIFENPKRLPGSSVGCSEKGKALFVWEGSF